MPFDNSKNQARARKMTVAWIITARDFNGRGMEYQPQGNLGRLGIRRNTGNRPLRPYYLAGPDLPEDWRGATFRTLAQAKAAAEDILADLAADQERTTT